MARTVFADDVKIGICNAYSMTNLPKEPHLCVAFIGAETTVLARSALFGEIMKDHGENGFARALQSQDRRRLWRARHDVFRAAKSFRAGAPVVVTDVCVPVSRLAECLMATKADIDRSGLIAPIVGRVGDGNFHTMPFVRMDDGEAVGRARDFLERLSRRAPSIEGTCSGEPGTGSDRMKYLAPEYAGRCIELMRSIKRSIDPQDILNPGKIA